MFAKLVVRTSCTNAQAARVRSKKRQWQIVGNILLPFMPIFNALLKGNSARKARCAHFVRKRACSARSARAIQKATMANRRQYPSVPSCQFSSPSFAPSYNFSFINRELVGAPCEATTVLLCALRAQITTKRSSYY